MKSKQIDANFQRIILDVFFSHIHHRVPQFIHSMPLVLRSMLSPSLHDSNKFWLSYNNHDDDGRGVACPDVAKNKD